MMNFQISLVSAQKLVLPCAGQAAGFLREKPLSFWTSSVPGTQGTSRVEGASLRVHPGRVAGRLRQAPGFSWINRLVPMAEKGLMLGAPGSVLETEGSRGRRLLPVSWTSAGREAEGDTEHLGPAGVREHLGLSVGPRGQI